MALDRSDIDIMSEAFRRAMDGSGGSLRAGQSGGSGGGGGRQMSAEEVKNLAKEAASASREFTKLRAGMRLTSAKQYEYQAAQRDVNTQLSQVESALEDYRKGKISLSKEEKKVLESKRKELSQLDDGSRANQAFQNGVMAVAGAIRNIGSTMIAGQAAVASAIQGGASGFGIALAQLTANANTQNAITQSVAGTMTGLSGALMNFGLVGRLAGGAMLIYAQKMAVESDLRTQAQNARNQILLSGGDALLKTYMEATRAGAVITDGFDGMNRSLQGSRYTMEDYTAIVKASGEQLAATGMGVGEASMMIGRVGKVLKDTKMDRSMLALGITYQEQGQLMAQVMADMRRRDPTRELNEREVAQRTKQYAHDLAVLSDITGKDAKAKMEESRKATGQLAFQQYLAGLGENGEMVGKAMETLSPQIRQNMMDMANFGNVVNKQGAIMTAANPALNSMQRELFAAMNAGKLNNDMAVQIQAKYSKSINEGMLSNRGLALAMAAPESKLASLGEASQTVREDILKMGEAAKVVARVTTEENRSLTGQEAPQTRLMLDMTEIGQDIRKAFQEHIIKNLEKMGPLLKQVLASIGADPKLPGNPGIKGVLENIWKALKELWEQSSLWEKVLIGVAGAMVALRGLAIGKSVLTDLKGLFTFGKSETLASGTTPGETRTERYRRPSGTYGTRQVPVGTPGGNLPSGAVPGGGTGGELGKFGAGIKSILVGLGQGAGGLIEGILTGIANGIGAFKPPVLIGAGILAGSIVVIGGAVAAATWMMGKALPTFAEGLTAFNTVNGENLKQVGLGAAALGAGLGVFGAGSALAGAGGIISNISDGLVKFFGGKTTLDRFREMAELAPKLKAGAEGIVTFTKAMGELLLLDVKKIDTLADKLERLQKASAAPERGFFSSMGQAAIGTMPDAVKNAIAKGEAVTKGGPTGAGQTAYLQGAAIVHLSQQTVNALKNTTGAVVTTPAVPNSRPTTMSTSKPEERTGGLTQASLNSLAKTDPVLFALTQLLEVERAKDRATDGQTSKIDIALKLMDRIAEDMAKQTGHQQEYATWARKNVLIKK